ncbi:MAG: DegV family protein [Clostridia bacterium]|nr:DegV family protein [Clostridia bacterium]
MEKYIIIADSTCDLCPELCDRFGVEAYTPGYVHISDGRDIRSYMNWESISREDFYAALSNKKLQVTSAPITPDELYDIFVKYVKDGYKIISMPISSKISSTYSVNCTVAEKVKKEYPDCSIYCFDSYKMSGALGLLTIYAHQLKQQGKSYEEVIQWLEANKHRVHQMGPIDDLIFVARRGRISMGKAIMGNFAGVKPMGDCNRDGYVTVLAKVKGINNALNATAQYLEKTATDIEDQYVLISHSNREEYAQKLAALIKERVSPKDILISDVFAGCGTNIGPGMVGVYFLGDELTEDLEKEKAVLNGILGK